MVTSGFRSSGGRSQDSVCGEKIKLTAQIWNSSPEDSSVKNMASGAKTPKIGENRQSDQSYQQASSKIQQTKMLVTCQRFGDLFLFGLVWHILQFRQNMIKVNYKEI